LNESATTTLTGTLKTSDSCNELDDERERIVHKQEALCNFPQKIKSSIATTEVQSQQDDDL